MVVREVRNVSTYVACPSGSGLEAAVILAASLSLSLKAHVEN